MYFRSLAQSIQKRAGHFFCHSCLGFLRGVSFRVSFLDHLFCAVESDCVLDGVQTRTQNSLIKVVVLTVLFRKREREGEKRRKDNRAQKAIRGHHVAEKRPLFPSNETTPLQMRD